MNRKLMVGLGIACVACCAPLIVPLLGAAGLGGLSGRLAGLDWLRDQNFTFIFCGLVVNRH